MRFSASYMEEAIFSLSEVIKIAQEDLKDVDFDTVVGTGFSGGLVIPALALAMGKKFILIRKETDDSHHGKGRLIGELGQRWIFVDDFVSSGRTRQRVIDKIDEVVQFEYEKPERVGQYLYLSESRRRWQPAGDESVGYSRDHN